MITVTPYAAEYAEGVVSVILPIQQQEFGVPITLEAQPDLTNISDFYQTGTGNFWIARVDKNIVGTIALLDIGNGQAALRKMFVAASHRGTEQGVARRLLETLLAWATEKEVREIFLGTTARFLAAHRFYEKNSFTEISKLALPATFPVMTVDTKFYRYVIKVDS